LLSLVDAYRGAADGAGDGRAVAVAVLAVTPVADRVGADAGPAAELLVGGADAGVDDVRVHVRRGGRERVLVVQRQVALVDPVQAVGRRVVLGTHDVHRPVRLDVRDPGVLGVRTRG